MKVAVLYRNKYSRRWQGVTFAKAVADVLNEIGYETSLHRDEIFGQFDLVIVITRRSMSPSLKEIGAPVVVYNNDPLFGRISMQRWARNFRNLSEGWLPNNCLGVIDHLEMNAEFFSAMGVRNRVLCRHGHHDLFDIKLDGPPKHDIGFLGTNAAGKRRRRLLEKLSGKYDVCAFPDWRTQHEWCHSANASDIRDCLDSKIWLHIAHEFDERNGEVVNEVFNQHRGIFFGLSNARCLVHETCSEVPIGLIPGKGFVVADYDRLPGAIDRLLNDEDRRKDIAMAGYEWARSNPMIDHWRKAMRRVEAWLR
jgi:hypothetical protein